MRVTIKEHPKIARHTKALLDGEDVTDRCFAADDEAGYVWMWKLDERGNRTRVRERKYGRIELYITVPDEPPYRTTTE